MSLCRNIRYLVPMNLICGMIFTFTGSTSVYCSSCETCHKGLCEDETGSRYNEAGMISEGFGSGQRHRIQQLDITSFGTQIIIFIRFIHLALPLAPPCILFILSSAALALLSLSNFIRISGVMPLVSSSRLSCAVFSSP